ncbi:hypothetical protein NL108_001979 [Boleophthalmus pectinirostris]|uniref:uncharacterized protein si:ch211-171b20.3 n=1 Tax=Boleophthalmus pectinirostris TaxID=150288 RepID=UPI00243249AB|nr:uncharacterized protein si:ch211-171b20.3 [Boleophthalmus pectinirostris]KAJ0059595.1 hypothetical protein NL108_001979 [Boleophthalmus pectinirostris]
MMTFQVKTAAVPTAKVLIAAEGGSSCSLRGPDVPQYPAAFRELRTMGASGGHAAVRHNIQLKRFPVIQPLSKPRDQKSLFTTFIVGGSPRLAKDDPPQANSSEHERNICGRHFLFDTHCVRPERTRSMIPPLPKDYHVHRPANLHPLSLPRGLTHSHKSGPFVLDCNEQFELTTSPAILVPSTFVLNGRNTFPVGNCKLSRSKANYPTYHLQTVKETQKIQTYADPVIGAPQSFLHRISELSSLQCETVRQERLKKMKKPRKPAS